MPDDKKLPVSLQLVGVTAAVVFCFSAIGAFNFARALWLKSEIVASLEASNQIELYAPLILLSAVCSVSLFTFMALLFRPVRKAALVSNIYLILLLLFLAVQLVSIFIAYFELPMPPQTLIIWVGVRVLYAGWLVGLLVKVWPNYSARRPADVGRR